MYQGWRRALLAGVLGLGVMAGLVRAGEGKPAPSPPAILYEAAPGTLVEPVPGDTGVPCFRGPAEFGHGFQDIPGRESMPPKASGRRHPLRNWVHNHPWGCWSHINSLGCGSLKSTCTFIFGSCRDFFGEPCLKGPPQLPGYDYGRDQPGDRRWP